MAVCSGTGNYNAGGIGHGKGLPRSLVAVGGSGVRDPWYMEGGAHSLFFAALFFPDSKK